MPSSQAIPPLNSPRIAPSRPSVTLGRALSEASNAQLAVMRSTFSDWTQKRGLQSYHCQNLCDEAKAEIRELFDCLTRRNRADLDLLCLASAVDTILEKGKYKFSGLKDIFRDMEAKERTGKVDFHKFRAYMSLLYDCPEGPSPTHHASAVMTKQQGLPGMILLVSGEHVKILDVLRSYSRRSFLADVQMQTERVQDMPKSKGIRVPMPPPRGASCSDLRVGRHSPGLARLAGSYNGESRVLDPNKCVLGSYMSALHRVYELAPLDGTGVSRLAVPASIDELLCPPSLQSSSQDSSFADGHSLSPRQQSLEPCPPPPCSRAVRAPFYRSSLYPRVSSTGSLSQLGSVDICKSASLTNLRQPQYPRSSSTGELCQLGPLDNRKSVNLTNLQRSSFRDPGLIKGSSSHNLEADFPFTEAVAQSSISEEVVGFTPEETCMPDVAGADAGAGFKDHPSRHTHMGSLPDVAGADAGAGFEDHPPRHTPMRSILGFFGRNTSISSNMTTLQKSADAIVTPAQCTSLSSHDAVGGMVLPALESAGSQEGSVGANKKGRDKGWASNLNTKVVSLVSINPKRFS